MNKSETASGAAGISSQSCPVLFTPRQCLAGLAVYFVIQVISRVLVSRTAELDESEQVILTQSFSWGYGSQPPLYAWLQSLFFQLFGINILALSALKNLLLSITFLFTYLNARLITKDSNCALAAAASLFFLPQVAWESQRDLTHSVLVTTLATATLFVVLKIVQSREIWLYAAAGLCIGGGLLAKYNFSVFVLGLLAAALSMPQSRSAVLNPRSLLTLGIALLLLLPHVLWAWQNPDLVFATAGKFVDTRKETHVLGFLRWIADVFMSAFIFGGPLVLVYFAILRKGLISKATAAASDLYERLIMRKLGIIFGGLVVAGLFAGLTNVKERWFLPILVCLPVLLISRVQLSLTLARIKQLVFAGLVVAASMAVVVPGHIMLVSKFGRPMRLNAPFRELAAQIQTEAAVGKLILAENRWIGGNLRLAFPDVTVWVPEIPTAPLPNEGPCLLVWDAMASALPPTELTELFGSIGGGDLGQIKPRHVEAVYQYGGKRRMRLGFFVAKFNSGKAEAHKDSVADP